MRYGGLDLGIGKRASTDFLFTFPVCFVVTRNGFIVEPLMEADDEGRVAIGLFTEELRGSRTAALGVVILCSACRLSTEGDVTEST